MNNNNRGILLIACGNPYYASWAWNLAAGIKYANPSEKISIAYSGVQALQFVEQVKSIFDNIIPIPDEYVKRNGFEAFVRAKTCLYDLSPYDETIYIDADVIWFYDKKTVPLWEEVNKTDLTMGCRGINDLNSDPRMIWCKAPELLNSHGANTVYNLSSEFIYFKKTQQTKEFFELSQKYFDNPGVDYTLFSGTVPDELAFQIAMMKSPDSIKPHKEVFLPFYWEPFHKKNLIAPEIYSNEWYGYSVGGNSITPTQKLLYDNLAILYGKSFGARFPFRSYSKKDVIKNREKV